MCDTNISDVLCMFHVNFHCHDPMSIVRYAVVEINRGGVSRFWATAQSNVINETVGECAHSNVGSHLFPYSHTTQ